MKLIKYLVTFVVICVLLGLGSIFGLYLYIKPSLPDVTTLREVELQTPMLVYSADGKLISQFGEKRRIPVSYENIPQPLIDALIATEDTRFYEHHGVDPIGIIRAVVVAITSGELSQGASTITQQLARNFFLNNERKLMRKVKEAFIALHIEQQLTKPEIMELYANKIFLGYRSYGFGAAAEVYFNKSLDELTLSEIATLAGLPKAPSTMNPIYSMQRAINRRNVVLKRMVDENYITDAEYNLAKNEDITVRYSTSDIELDAGYVAEMARAWAVDRYGSAIYESGMRVYTTIDSKLQVAAEIATANNLFSYDERHGYRGATATLWDNTNAAWNSTQIQEHLDKQPSYGPLVPAVVTNVRNQTANIELSDNRKDVITWNGMKWAREFKTDSLQGPAPTTASDILKTGQQIWVRQVGKEWQLSQIPAANTAMIAISPNDGSVKALIGGFNYELSKFNRVMQSVRQVGSSIKPFIYSAALDKGTTLATLVNDAPISQWDESLGTAWRPKNSPAIYNGLTRVRLGLAQSKNVMAVRLLRRVGLDETINFMSRFGFTPKQLPRAESLALGSGSVTPISMAQGYSVFANGGHFIQTNLIDRVEDSEGNIIYQNTNLKVCTENCLSSDESVLENLNAGWRFNPEQINTEYAPRVLSEQNAFLVRQMLESNIWGGAGWNGTGYRAKSLKRHDIGGKTGTTNDAKDAWYAGFGPDLTAVIWVGFDNHSRALGKTSLNKNIARDAQFVGSEAGGSAALPGWIDFMGAALANTPERKRPEPENMVRLRIDKDTGLLTRKTDSSSTFEYFIKGTEPTTYGSSVVEKSIYNEGEEELF